LLDRSRAHNRFSTRSIDGAPQRERFVTTRESTAFFKEDHGYAGRPLPAGSLIMFDPYSLIADGLLEVVWKNQTVLMFAEDLRTVAIKFNGRPTQT
jgi:hypothetical protein